MFADVCQWCHSCTPCATQKPPAKKTVAPLTPLPVEGPFDRAAVDIVGPLPQTHDGSKYIIVFCDYLTTWPEALALPDTKADRIARVFVEEVNCLPSRSSSTAIVR